MFDYFTKTSCFLVLGRCQCLIGVTYNGHGSNIAFLRNSQTIISLYFRKQIRANVQDQFCAKLHIPADFSDQNSLNWVFTMFRACPTVEFDLWLLATVPRVSLFWSGTGKLLSFRDINTLKWAIFSELQKGPDSSKSQKNVVPYSVNKVQTWICNAFVYWFYRFKYF